ncbi:MAG: DUF302 domain-containing protein [bacterium]|nr:DUF302 domain-containing protein [bacterium]
MEYGYKRNVQLSFQDAVEKVKEELAKEGFGVLTEIDVKATLKKKLDVEYDQYLILGACNPTFAYAALQAEKDIGLLLPCNVVVYEEDEAVFVSVILPTVAMNAAGTPSLLGIAKTVEEKLKEVINNV